MYQAESIYWHNLPPTTIKPRDLEVVFKPILDTLTAYKNEIRQQSPIVTAEASEFGVVIFKINPISNDSFQESSLQLDAQDRENISILGEDICSAKTIELNGINRVIQGLSRANYILTNPKIRSETTITRNLKNRSYKITFTPITGTFLQLNFDSEKSEDAFHMIFRGRAYIKTANTKEEEKKKKFFKSLSIRIRFEQDEAILVHQELPTGQFKIQAERDYANIERKIRALLSLMERPKDYYFPLIKLFEENTAQNNTETIFPHNINIDRSEWKYLGDDSYPGVNQQRDFVEIALNTPDFAIMEGPPGSGKTTTILEILHQATKRDLRVLMVASTHVAVDNVLERIHEERINGKESHIFPIRIGYKDDVSGISEEYLPENISETESERIITFLKSFSKKKISESQQLLLEQLESKKDALQSFIFEIANVVCGTTIGILRHPDFNSSNFDIKTPYDILIIDEASKTTFQEFLIPALMAKRWIIIGDKNQLPPYIEDEEVKILSERSKIPGVFEEDHQQLCLDYFWASKGNAVLTNISKFYDIMETHRINSNKNLQQENNQIILVKHINDLKDPIAAQGMLIDYQIFESNQAQALMERIPADMKLMISRIWMEELRNVKKARLARKIQNYRKSHNCKTEYLLKTKKILINPPNEKSSWIDEISWRLKRMYELRHHKPNPEGDIDFQSVPERLKMELDVLLPKWNFQIPQNLDKLSDQDIHNIFISCATKYYNPNSSTQGRRMDLSDFIIQDTKSTTFRGNWIKENYNRDPTYFDDLLTYYVGNMVFDTLRIEFPSIIELLQTGLMIEPKYRNSRIFDCTIYKGFSGNQSFWKNREIKLEYQHRMHPDISKFIREQFYQGKQVKDPSGRNGTYNIADKRAFSYRKPSELRNVWVSVNGNESSRNAKSPVNLREVEKVKEIYDSIEKWTTRNPKQREKGEQRSSPNWTIAILTFYRGQEGELIRVFRKHFNKSYGKEFSDRKSYIQVKICSVDRFQGQEADFVIVSFVRTQSPGFLDCINRLNVGLSRAKYQQFIVGNKSFFQKEKVKRISPILYKLATTQEDIIFGGEKNE